MGEQEKGHECKISRACCCSVNALEPSEECPIHGCGEWPRRCAICGKFITAILPKEVVEEIEQGRAGAQAGETMPIEQVRAAAHPASLEQECYSYLRSIVPSDEEVYPGDAEGLIKFICTKLAESRAAMREEAAKLAESWTNADGSNEPTTSAIASEIRSLPSDSSALDARDARVAKPLIEAMTNAVALLNGAQEELRVFKARAYLNDALAQRSAEKGKGQ